MNTTVRAAAWHEHAEPITDPAVGVPLGSVAERCGLAPRTITYAMNRGRAVADPLAALYRPRYRLGSEPRWDAQQIDDYCAARDARDANFLRRYGDLPRTTAEQARADGLVSLTGAARAVNVALTTLHRWANEDSFPKAVALVGNRSPTPRVMRRWSEIAQWMRQNRPRIAIPDDPFAVADPKD